MSSLVASFNGEQMSWQLESNVRAVVADIIAVRDATTRTARRAAQSRLTRSLAEVSHTIYRENPIAVRFRAPTKPSRERAAELEAAGWVNINDPAHRVTYEMRDLIQSLKSRRALQKLSYWDHNIRSHVDKWLAPLEIVAAARLVHNVDELKAILRSKSKRAAFKFINATRTEDAP